MKNLLSLYLLILSGVSLLFSGDIREIAVGQLQSWFIANGAEYEIGRTNDISDQQDGLRWPAQFKWQDTQAAKGLWIGTTDYTDAPQYGGNTYSYKVVHVGPRVYGDNEFFPVEFKLIGKFSKPQIFVEGREASSLTYLDKPDEIDPMLNCDRKIINVMNTSIGITVKRTILAWTNQDHDNYFVYEYTFTNTGNVDADEEIEQNVTLKDVWFFFQYRYAPTREACAYGYAWLPQSATWGASTMLDVRGEDPNSGDPFRAMFSWLGKHSRWEGPGDNIGGPNFVGDGRLGAAQYVGVVTLHADRSAQDFSDDAYQPKTTQYVNSDAPYTYGNSQFNGAKMEDEYQLMSAGHSERMSDLVGDGDADLFGDAAGGYSHGQGFGPYILAPGDSVHIVLAEGVAGLNREKCYEIGANWLNGSAPFNLPDGSTTDDANQYKNAWVFTGRDSLFNTFRKAIDNYQSGYNIPSPPPPPELFEVYGSCDHIKLYWTDNAESSPNFGGYIIYRTVGRYDTIYHPIFSCGLNTNQPEIVHSYEDHNVQPNKNYYYYIVSFDDGSNNNGTPLQSNLFWTRTSEAVKLDTIDRVDADLFVSPDGDDANSGLTNSEPLRTIGRALAMIITGKYHRNTIFLDQGVYSSSVNGEKFPILVNNDYLTLRGSGKQKTVIDAAYQNTVFKISGNSISLNDLTIQNGQGPENSTQGGGIHASWAKGLVLTDVTIRNNNARSGGGIFAVNSQIELNNVSIHDNTVTAMGGGIYFDAASRLVFSDSLLSNIYGNTADFGYDVYGEKGTIAQHFPLDTLTVLSPSDYYVFPIGKITVTAQNYITPQKDADLYVSPQGDDQNDGLTASTPLKTITEAIKQIKYDPHNPHTIHLAEGVYSDSVSQEHFPLYGNLGLKISGISAHNTVLDGGAEACLFYLNAKNGVRLENITLRNGHNSHGGGMVIVNSEVELKNMLIEHNNATTGGGVFGSDSAKVRFSPVTIRQNTGGGIYLQNHATASFDSVQRSNIYFNTLYKDGWDLYNDSEPITVILDTFTVKYPVEKYAFPLSNFSFDILNGKIPQAEADLYVSPSGDDQNDGLSQQTPFKTITKAMELIFADSLRPHKIILADGTYSTSLTGETFPIFIKKYVTITGQSQEGTILDGENTNQLILINHVKQAGMQNLTLTNGQNNYGGALKALGSVFNIDHVTFTNNNALKGGAMYVGSSQGRLSHLIIQGNSVTSIAGGLYVEESDLELERVIFANNYADNRCGAFLVNGGKVTFIHNTITGNTTKNDRYGVFYSAYPGNLIFANTIIWNNGTNKPISARSAETTLTFFHTDLEGGYEGLSAVSTSPINWLEGNKDADPLFKGGEPFDYNLTAASPCVDRGATFFVWENDTILNMTDDEYQGNAPDMGALESEFSVGIAPNGNSLPKRLALYQNYPNPFNPSTTIKFAVAKKTHVKLLILDILGRKVATLIDKTETPGYKKIIWTGKNDQGNPVASGVYIISLSTREKKLVRKMILLK